MPDYGRTLEFGANADPIAQEPTLAARVARVADASGLDLVAMQDHPYHAGFFDTWTQLATLVPQTERVRFFPDVANLPLRPPAMLAKAAATLDLLSGGRVELGVGAGSSLEAVAAMGGPDRGPGEAVAALEEAIQVIRLMWSGRHGVRFAGQHYRLDGLDAGPRPAHPIGIWLGASGPRMLALTGRLADGVVVSTPYEPPERLPALHARIDAASRAAGRDPRQLRRAYNVMGLIQPSACDRPLVGPASHWVAELTRYATEFGMDTFVYWPLADHVHQVERFAADVVPAVRAAVAQTRAEHPPEPSPSPMAMTRGAIRG